MEITMKIFIAGPRAITSLPQEAKARLHGIYEKGYTILVGDANGVDKAIQKYYATLGYDNVIVYASNGAARNNIGDWPVEAVEVAGNIKGFNFYAMKDKAMARDADYGFMLWNGESKGTLSNIINLLADGKKSLVYFRPDETFVTIDSHEALENLLISCPEETMKLYKTQFPS